MNFYFVKGWEDQILEVGSSVAEVKNFLRTTGTDPEELVVELRDVPTDKDSLRSMLAQACGIEFSVTDHGRLLRVWNVTKRRGLKEAPKVTS